MMGIQGLYKTKQSWGGCHYLLLVYDASKISTVYVKPSQNKKGYINLQLHRFLNTFSQLPAVKKDKENCAPGIFLALLIL